MKTNFINRSGRTYLISNPDQLGNGTELGYYRESFGQFPFQAVLKKPYHSEQGFQTEKEAQDWLVEQSRRY